MGAGSAGPRRPLARLLGAVTVALALVAVTAAVVGYARGYRVVLVRSAPAGGTKPPVDFSPRPAIEQLKTFPAEAQPKSVVIVLGDGMGLAQLLAARVEAEGVHGRLFLERFPFTGWVTTYAADALYTDSASAATALWSGFKTRPRMLGRTPDGRSPRTILEAGLASGMRGGLITTTSVFDATPAGLVAHADSRRDRVEIAR